MRENRTSGICGGALETGSVEMAADLSTAWETARDTRDLPSSAVYRASVLPGKTLLSS